MPTLKDLQNAVASAQSTYNSALADKTSKQVSMQNQHTEFQNCKYKWSIPPVGTLIDINGCDSGVIASQHPGCGSKNTCESRVQSYNQSVAAFNNANTALSSAKTALDAAQLALDNFIKSDPESLNQQNARRNATIVIVVVVVAAAIGITIYLLKKYKVF